MRTGLTYNYMQTLGVQMACIGAVASWLVRSTPDRVVPVRALAAVIVLCS